MEEDGLRASNNLFTSRRSIAGHGTAQAHLLAFNILLTLGLALSMDGGVNYLIIALSSGLLDSAVEYRLVRMGSRKIAARAFGRDLSKSVSCLLRGFVEGPGWCVPAFFFADMAVTGRLGLAVGGVLIYVAAWAAYSGYQDIRPAMTGQREGTPIHSRRLMTHPRSVIGVVALSSFAVAALFMMETPDRSHGFHFLLGALTVSLAFFVVSRLMDVRIIERFDIQTGEFRRASGLDTLVGYVYNGAFEMAAVFTLYYLIPYGLGLFDLSHLVP